MSKKLFCLLALLSIALAAHASQVLLETHQEGVQTIPEKQNQTLDVLSLNFQVDTACFVQINAGGNVMFAEMAITLDENALFPIVRPRDCAGYSFVIPYATFVSTGNHTITLKFTNYMNQDYPAECRDAYLQALIFLPDEPSSVSETHVPKVEPSAAHTLIATGPWVDARGATELYDANGRKVSAVPQDGRISLQALPGGTYFAREGDTRTVLKIVKVR